MGIELILIILLVVFMTIIVAELIYLLRSKRLTEALRYEIQMLRHSIALDEQEIGRLKQEIERLRGIES